MTTTNRPLFLLAAMAASLGVASRAAAVVPSLSYNFFQDGYAEGATVTGSFAGIDADGNGLLIHFPGATGAFPINALELTSWSMHFSGNSHSPAFDLGLSDLYGFAYEIGSSGVGDGPAFDPTLNRNLTEGIGAIGSVRFYTTGLGPNSVVSGYVGAGFDLNNPTSPAANALDSSTHLALVTPVPEPGSAALIAVAGLTVAVARTRRSRASRLV